MAQPMSAHFLVSELLPISHGFTTREGGVSEGPYASLNLGRSVGDVPERVEENTRRVAQAAGVAPSDLQSPLQVHGDQVLEAPNPDPQLGGSVCGRADALWTSRTGAAVAVRIADCVPLLLVDRQGRRVAAVHSGWRGTELRIAARAVDALAEAGAERSALLAAIGPSIRVCCYQVSRELAERFARLFGDGVVAHRHGEAHLDLATAVRETLQAAGVRRDHIDVLPNCTSCETALFFSHRRDRGVTGRQMAFAVCSF